MRRTCVLSNHIVMDVLFQVTLDLYIALVDKRYQKFNKQRNMCIKIIVICTTLSIRSRCRFAGL